MERNEECANDVRKETIIKQEQRSEGTDEVGIRKESPAIIKQEQGQDKATGERELGTQLSRSPITSVSATYTLIDGIEHAGQSILTLDVAPIQVNPVHVVTGGKDGAVKIWSIDSLCGNSQGNCKCLATMAEHLSLVNCVRWSTDASYVASGDTDGTILVWWQDPRFATGTGSEPWRRKWLLRGHGAEICDISWHPFMNPRFTFASCSFDGSVRLWNVVTGETSTVLRSPENSCIKGVAFDPLGQFLAAMPDASLSSRSQHALLWERPVDEQTTALPWRPIQIGTLSKLDSAAIPTLCFSQRPSWDPLGKAVAFPCGEISTRRKVQHFGVVFERGHWKTPKKFVGHSHAVSLVRFSPVAFHVPTDKDDPSTMSAFASNNGAISIHVSCFPRPLVSVLCPISGNDFLTDMCWAPGGDAIFCSTNEGRITCLSFSIDGIGATLRNDDLAKCRTKKIFAPSSWLGAVNSAHLDVGRLETNKRKRSASPSHPTEQDELSHMKTMHTWLETDGNHRTTNETTIQSHCLCIANGDDYIELRINTGQHQSRNVAYIEARPVSDYRSDVQRTIGSPFWRTSLSGRISAASMCSQYIGFVLDHDGIPGRLLHVLETQTGSQLIAPIVMESATQSLHFPADGRAILIVDQRRWLQVWSFHGKNSLELVVNARLPASFDHPVKVRLVPTSFVPFFIKPNGDMLAFNKHQKLWCRIDTYGFSQLGTSPPNSENTLGEFFQKYLNPRWPGKRTKQDRQSSCLQNRWLLEELGSKVPGSEAHLELERLQSDYEHSLVFGRSRIHSESVLTEHDEVAT